MFKLQKKFMYPIGHRLSKHDGLCKGTHGHEFVIIISIKSRILNRNNMVIDFSIFKKMVKNILEKFDHGLMINKNDNLRDNLNKCNDKIIEFDGDPTAESLSKYIYMQIRDELYYSGYVNIQMDFVTVYENQNSAVTYTEED